jgi:hypothetical protein
MGGYFVPPLTPEQAAAVAQVPTLAASTAIILSDAFTVDTLPDPATVMGKYARVTDLFGATTDLVLAAKTGTMAYWKPVRPDFAGKQTVTADMTLTALKMPSVLLLDGTVPLGATRKITLSNNLAFPGASFRFKQRGGGLGTILGALQVLNVNLASTVSIVTGGTQEFVYDLTDGWVQVT